MSAKRREATDFFPSPNTLIPFSRQHFSLMLRAMFGVSLPISLSGENISSAEFLPRTDCKTKLLLFF